MVLGPGKGQLGAGSREVKPEKEQLPVLGHDDDVGVSHGAADDGRAEF